MGKGLRASENMELLEPSSLCNRSGVMNVCELATVLWKISSSLKTLIFLLSVCFTQKYICLHSGRLLISTGRRKALFWRNLAVQSNTKNSCTATNICIIKSATLQ